MPANSALRITQEILIVVLIALLLQRYRYRRKMASIQLNDLSTRGLILEVLIVIIHVPPGLDQSFTTTTGYNGLKVITPIADLITIIMFARLYFIVKLLSELSQWRSGDAESCCEASGCSATLGFAIRASLRRHAFLTIVGNLVISGALMGYFVRMLERPYSQGFDSYHNSIWFAFITMSTVGYGDYTAKTLWGRLVSALGCIWGTTVISQMIVVIQNSSAFSLAQ